MGSSDPGHTRIVADADVLAADVLVGGASRAVLDLVRSHSWLDLVATDRLLADARAVLADLTEPALAADWREAIDPLVEVVDQPAGDHPALAAAYRGDAAHVVSMDDRLHGVAAGATLNRVMDVSVRSPDAFASVFDPGAVYELVFEDRYPGPDRPARE